jgi:hypothetical protein
MIFDDRRPMALLVPNFCEQKWLVFHRRIAAPEFSRGFQPTVGVVFHSPSRQRRLNSAVADATQEYSPNVPWVETHG